MKSVYEIIGYFYKILVIYKMDKDVYELIKKYYDEFKWRKFVIMYDENCCGIIAKVIG